MSEPNQQYHQALSANRKLLAEIACLKAEVVRLKQVRDYEHYLSAQIGSMNQENASLKAEVERLTFRPEHYLDDDGEWVSNIVFYRMQERLKAEVERLTKAANEAAYAWSVYENGLIETPEWVKRSQVRDAISRLWNAAKEGKPQP